MEVVRGECVDDQAGHRPRPVSSSTPPAARQRLREELGIGSGEYLIGTVACLKPQKAPEDVIAVAKLVCSRMPGARFVLIGDGVLRSRLEAQINGQGLQDKVRLAGWSRCAPRDGLLRPAPADLRLEGLPRVMLEAATAGCPSWPPESAVSKRRSCNTTGSGYPRQATLPVLRQASKPCSWLAAQG